MKHTWLPPVAALVTGAVIWLAGRVPAAAAVAPLVLPGLWLAMWLREARPALVVAMAVLGVIGGAVGLPAVPAAILAAYVAAGLAGGAALERGWSTLAVVGVMAALMVPGLLLGLQAMPMSEELSTLAGALRQNFAEKLPASATEAQRAASTAEFERQMAGALKVSLRIWPSLLALGLLAQAALGYGLGRLLARAGGARLVRPGGRPFAVWEVPGVTVWLLAAGLSLLLVAREPGKLAGLNLTILAGLALSVQGVAVQAWVTGRYLPPAGRAVYWLLAAFFLAPVVVAAGAFIGLMDQWWDLRKLHRGPEQAEEGGSPWK
jgi:hypothetical protein